MCLGNEKNLEECAIGPVGRVNCLHSKDVSVNCNVKG